jgi:hypothetical protein
LNVAVLRQDWASEILKADPPSLNLKTAPARKPKIPVPLFQVAVATLQHSKNISFKLLRNVYNSSHSWSAASRMKAALLLE